MNKAQAKKLFGKRVVVSTAREPEEYYSKAGTLEGVVKGRFVQRQKGLQRVQGIAYTWSVRNHIKLDPKGSDEVYAVKLDTGEIEYFKGARYLHDAGPLEERWARETEANRVQRVKEQTFKARAEEDLPGDNVIYEGQEKVVFHRLVEVPKGWRVIKMVLELDPSSPCS